MASMVIRNISDELMTRVKDAAKREGKSAEQIAREALAEKVKPSREEIIRRMDEIRASSKRVSGQEIVDEIRRQREHDLERTYPGLDDDP